MTNFRPWILCLGIAVIVAPEARTQDRTLGVEAQAKTKVTCKTSMLSGYFIYAQDGFVVEGTNATQRTPFAQSGREFFDGDGNMTGIFTVSLNGTVSRGRYSGKYDIAPDCSGTVTFTDNFGKTFHFDIYAADGGDEFTFIQTDAGVVSAAYERRRASK